jgi:heme exporter protein D
MTFVWMALAIVVVALDVLTIVDVVRRPFGAGLLAHAQA